MVEKTLVETVRDSLNSDKVDPFLAHEFEHLVKGNPYIDLSRFYVPFLLMSKTEISSDYFLSRPMGSDPFIYSINAPYTELIRLIENENVVSVEGSRPVGSVESTKKIA